MPPKRRLLIPTHSCAEEEEEGCCSSASSMMSIPIGRQLNPHIIACLEDELKRCGQPSASNHYYRTLRNAITAIEKHPKKINNGTEAKALKGIGDKTAFKIDKYLKDNNIDLGVSSSVEDISNQQDNTVHHDISDTNNEFNFQTGKKKRKYIPKFKSTAWSIMISIYRLCKEHTCETVTKQQIIESCRKLSDTPMDKSTNGSNYTGWSSMKTLLDHGYVSSQKKGNYSLTNNGRRIARRLHIAEKDLTEKSFTWNESEDEFNSSSSQDERPQTKSKNNALTSKNITKHSEMTTSNTNTSQIELYSSIEFDPDLDMELFPSNKKIQNNVNIIPNSTGTLRDHSEISTTTNLISSSFSTPVFIVDDHDDIESCKIDFSSFGIQAFYVDDHLKETMTLNKAKMSIDRSSGSLCRMVRVVLSCPQNRFILEKQIFDSPPEYHNSVVTLEGSNTRIVVEIATGLVKESRCTEHVDDLLHSLIVDSSSLVLLPKKKTLLDTQSHLHSMEIASSSQSLSCVHESDYDPSLYLNKANNSVTTTTFTTTFNSSRPSKKRKKIPESSCSLSLSHRLDDEENYEGDNDTQEMPPPSSSSSHVLTITKTERHDVNQNTSLKSSMMDASSRSGGSGVSTDNHSSAMSNSLKDSVENSSTMDVIDFDHYGSITTTITTTTTTTDSNNNTLERVVVAESIQRQQQHQQQLYKIHLIADQRERTGKNDFKMICETLKENHVNALIHQLSLGDMIWIATKCSNDNSESHVLNFIVERKEINDLSASLIDGRFEEQKFRLQHTHCSNIIYLIEKESNVQPQIESTILKLIQEGIQVKHTVSLEASIQFLVQMNEMIIQLVEENGIEPYKLRVPYYWNDDDEFSSNMMMMTVMNSSETSPPPPPPLLTITTHCCGDDTIGDRSDDTIGGDRSDDTSGGDRVSATTALSPLGFLHSKYTNNKYDRSTPQRGQSAPLQLFESSSHSSLSNNIPVRTTTTSSTNIAASCTVGGSTGGGGGVNSQSRLSSPGSSSNSRTSGGALGGDIGMGGGDIHLNPNYYYYSSYHDHHHHHHHFECFNPTLEEYNATFQKTSFRVNKKVIFARQLASSVPGCSPRIASSIILHYPTPSSLEHAFKKHGENALQHVPIVTDNATQVPTRKVGRALSKKLYELFKK
ncbi:hypothetical protein FDP41_001691 [Naegleria fowleri]|uniref:Crossover junction endonuclease MUS81 n=1 Tax=Naegleria fowleri TaxID=5763 RepID=A0A6A5C0C1_NAEFO|nr:uncharacterized protein FDP41_001691 [Naegleria fowleri]KAF0979348.1 hypothetical protein FDP41_001691 [Naegleria fowleri]